MCLFVNSRYIYLKFTSIDNTAATLTDKVACMNTHHVGAASAPRILAEKINELGFDRFCVSSSALNEAVLGIFENNRELNGLAVVDDGLAVGMIVRSDLLAKFAKPYARELFLKKPCLGMAKTDFLALEGGMDIGDAGTLVAARGESALTDGFIILEDGRFLGVCSGITLVQALADLQSEQHRQLVSGIDYASTIQTALLEDSRKTLIRDFRGRHELVWRPRDIVGGDCFFAHGDASGVLIGVIDCTGHGVPGALLTSVALSEANRLIADPEVRESPAAMLKGLNLGMKAALQQHDASDLNNTRADDGMDAPFLFASAVDETIRLASAKLPAMRIRPDGSLEVIKGDRKGLGYRDTPSDFEWTEREFPMADFGRAFLITDGLCDQIGWEKPIAFGWNRIGAALTATAAQSVQAQVTGLMDAFNAYQGPQARRDDVTILGLEFSPIAQEPAP